MSLRKSLLVLACLALVLVPLQAAMAAALPKLMLTEIIPNGANRPNPTTGANYTEAYEMMEIYNNSDQKMPLKDFKIMFGPAGTETELAWLDNSDQMVIPARGVLVVWAKQASNPFALDDFFKHNQAKNPDLQKEQIAIVLGPQMHNTQDRSGWLEAADGTVICKFSYVGVGTETVDDKAIKFAYPTDGTNVMRKISFGAESFSTPGILDDNQKPVQ